MTNIGLCSDNEGFPGSKKIDDVVVEEGSFYDCDDEDVVIYSDITYKSGKDKIRRVMARSKYILLKIGTPK